MASLTGSLARRVGEGPPQRGTSGRAPFSPRDVPATEMTPDQVRVWVDDHHPVFRCGLGACLAAGQFQVVGESTGFSPAPDPHDIDVLIFGAEVATLQPAVRLTRDRPVTLVAIVGAPVTELVHQAVEAGVAAVLLRAELTPRGLVSCLASLANGTACLPAKLVPKLLEQAARRSPTRADVLADRERKVLRLLAQGEDTRQVADHLCYSERTVKNIVHDLLVKMNCNNRAHAVAVATRQGII